MPQIDSTDADDDWPLSGASGVRRIGPYEVLGTIGRGGMGEVYLDRDEKLDREIALKLIHPTFLGNEIRAVQEIKILKKLDHDGIVRLLGDGKHEGQTYFTMEYVDGLSLAELLNKNREANRVPCSTVRELLAPLGTTALLGGPLSDVSLDAPAYVCAIRIAQQIAVALNYLHEGNIIHRDVKPSNVLIKHNGRVLLTDFGIAFMPRESDDGDRTNPGTFLGTERYAAPEQHASRPVDPRTDVYGLGAVLYELVTGVQLFDGTENRHELISDALSHPPKSPILLAPKIPRALNAIILIALSKERKRRFATTLEFAEALQELIIPKPPSLMQKAKRTSLGLIWAFFLTGLVLSLGAAAALFFYEQLQQRSWLHPLLPAVIPVAAFTAAGIVLGALWFALCSIWALICRFGAWLRRPRAGRLPR